MIWFGLFGFCLRVALVVVLVLVVQGARFGFDLQSVDLVLG